MSDKRFIALGSRFIKDTLTGEEFYAPNEDELLDLLNKQQDTIITLKRRLEKINGGYGHLTHRNGLTANEWVIESQERELKKKNEQISDWIEQHSKDIVKIGEQQATIKKQDIEIQSLNLHIEKLVDGDEISQLLMREYERSDELEKENEQLKQRLRECGMRLDRFNCR